MIQYLTSQRRKTSVVAMFCWLLLSVFSCESMASGVSTPAIESGHLLDQRMDSGSIVYAGVHSADNSSANSSAQASTAMMDMACCDQLLQRLECCAQPSVALSGFSNDRSSPDISTVYIATELPTYEWMAPPPPTIEREFPQHSQWLMDSYPRPHLVHCIWLV